MCLVGCDCGLPHVHLIVRTSNIQIVFDLFQKPVADLHTHASLLRNRRAVLLRNHAICHGLGQVIQAMQNLRQSQVRIVQDAEEGTHRDCRKKRRNDSMSDDATALTFKELLRRFHSLEPSIVVDVRDTRQIKKISLTVVKSIVQKPPTLRQLQQCFAFVQDNAA